MRNGQDPSSLATTAFLKIQKMAPAPKKNAVTEIGTDSETGLKRGIQSGTAGIMQSKILPNALVSEHGKVELFGASIVKITGLCLVCLHIGCILRLC